MRCAERTQACRCESKGSHYYCQKEPSSLLKVWRVLLLQSTQLQNLSENALTLVLIPTSMLSEGPIICFGKSSSSSVFTRLTVVCRSSRSVNSMPCCLQYSFHCLYSIFVLVRFPSGPGKSTCVSLFHAPCACLSDPRLHTEHAVEAGCRALRSRSCCR